MKKSIYVRPRDAETYARAEAICAEKGWSLSEVCAAAVRSFVRTNQPSTAVQGGEDVRTSSPLDLEGADTGLSVDEWNAATQFDPFDIP